MREMTSNGLFAALSVIACLLAAGRAHQKMSCWRAILQYARAKLSAKKASSHPGKPTRALHLLAADGGRASKRLPPWPAGFLPGRNHRRALAAIEIGGREI